MSTPLVKKKPMAPDFIRDVKSLLALTAWNQAELARRLAIDKATVTNWLNGKTRPDGTARYAIADLIRRAKAGDFREAIPA